MRIILITQRIEEIDSYQETRDALDIRWNTLLLAAGFFPIVIPNNYEYLSILFQSSIMNDVSGIILSGGNDHKIRNKIEKSLLDFAQEKELPILGICHGMQLIQEHFDNSIQKIDDHINRQHQIISTNKSKINNLIDQLNIETFYHLYGTNNVSKPLNHLAKSPDGIVIAVKHQDKEIYGFMWHPERSSNISIQRQLLRAIF